MNTVYVVCLVAFFIHLLAVPGFIWSLRRRQFRESDEEAFRAVHGDASPPLRAPQTAPETAPLLPVTRTRKVVLFGFLVLFFALLLASLVYLMVAAGQGPAASGSD